MITEEQFEIAVGNKPEQGDLERANCSVRGIKHTCCGWCGEHNRPVFYCDPDCWYKPERIFGR